MSQCRQEEVEDLRRDFPILELNFMIDHRPGSGIRIAPHFYTLESEVEAVMETIRELQEGEER